MNQKHAWQAMRWVGMVLVVGRYPSNGAVNVSRNTGIVVCFSEAMDPKVYDHVNFSGAGGVNVIRQYNPEPGIVMLIPTSAWPANTTITVTVDTGAKDSSGNALAAAVNFSFTTANTTAGDMVYDTPFSTLYAGMDSVETNLFNSYNRPFYLAFKDSSSGFPAVVDAADLSPGDYLFYETATGIPIKGVSLEAEPDRGGQMSFYVSRGCPGVQDNTSYTLSFKNTIKNSEGTAITPFTLSFTTRAAASASRPSIDRPETEYRSVGPTSAGHAASLRLKVNTSYLALSTTLTVTAQDDTDTGFNPTLTSSGGDDYNYESSGAEANLPTNGWHAITYTVDSSSGSLSQSVKSYGYLFDGIGFPASPTATNSNTPTFTWGSTAALGGDAQALILNDGSSNQIAFLILDANTTSFTWPSDHPLPSGSYSVNIGVIKLARNGTIGSSPGGFGIVNEKAFTAP